MTLRILSRKNTAFVPGKEIAEDDTQTSRPGDDPNMKRFRRIRRCQEALMIPRNSDSEPPRIFGPDQARHSRRGQDQAANQPAASLMNMENLPVMSHSIGPAKHETEQCEGEKHDPESDH
jgi:hypothetical protein